MLALERVIGKKREEEQCNDHGHRALNDEQPFLREIRHLVSSEFQREAEGKVWGRGYLTQAGRPAAPSICDVIPAAISPENAVAIMLPP